MAIGIERWPDHGTSHTTHRCAHVDLARLCFFFVLQRFPTIVFTPPLLVCPRSPDFSIPSYPKVPSWRLHVIGGVTHPTVSASSKPQQSKVELLSVLATVVEFPAIFTHTDVIPWHNVKNCVLPNGMSISLSTIVLEGRRQCPRPRPRPRRPHLHLYRRRRTCRPSISPLRSKLHVFECFSGFKIGLGLV